MRRSQKWMLGTILFMILGQAHAAQTTVEVHALNNDPQKKGVGESLGTIEFIDSDKGLVIKPKLKRLPSGPHGFHVHENGSCEGGEENGKWEPGALAGGHLDPAHTEKHLGPNGKGHHGDLPVLTVDKNGEANETTVAPHLTVSDLHNHSVVIHAGGDNYSDQPEPLGGGRARIACGTFS